MFFYSLWNFTSKSAGEDLTNSRFFLHLVGTLLTKEEVEVVFVVVSIFNILIYNHGYIILSVFAMIVDKELFSTGHFYSWAI